MTLQQINMKNPALASPEDTENRALNNSHGAKMEFSFLFLCNRYLSVFTVPAGRSVPYLSNGIIFRELH